jgi:hypothetical protein
LSVLAGAEDAAMRLCATATLLAAAAALASCGTGGSERDAKAAVERFSAAVAAQDGAAACEQLSEEAQSTIEQQERQPCERAILALELSPSTPADAEVAITSAVVATEEGDTVFLDQTSQGWRISAAGCDEVPGQPYDCELES